MQTRTSRRRSRTWGGVAIAAGAVIAVAGGVILVIGLQHDSGEPAALPSTSATVPSTSSAGTSSRAATKSSKASASSAPSPRTSSRTATALPKPTSNSTPVPIANPAGAACIPKSLSVSSIGITGEQIVAMGTNSQGQIYPPAHTTMWYDRSAQPGQDGISVIAGHVTYDGPDNFYNLRNVSVGTRVTVVCANDKVVNLEVTHMESIPKDKLTTDQRVWGGSSTPVVTLVTCDINSPMVAGHHLNNFVVWTRPAA